MRAQRWSSLACAVVLAASLTGTIHGATPARGMDRLLGVWVPDAAPRALLTADGKAPPLTADAAKLHAQRRALLAKGDASFDPTTWCAGPGMPRMLTMPYPFEIRSDNERIAFIHGWYRWFRIVDLGAGTVDPPLSLTMGFPTARWEGETLVIRTIGLTDATVLDASGLPRSEQMTLTERLRVLPNGRLEDRITIEDPENYSKPWETVLTFHRDAQVKVQDDVCPDRLAKGEPAELLTASKPARAATPPPPARAAAAAAAPAMATARFTGVFEPKGFAVTIPNTPLSAAGQEVVARNTAATSRGAILQTAWVSCRPGAVSAITMPREKIVVMETPDEVTLLFEMPRMVRRIRMNATHPATLEPSYLGDSVGRWEGNTLVVDTVGYNGFGELDARGQPTSAKLHTVERFTRAADGGIDIETTLEDAEYYSQPFVIKRAWKTSPARHPYEYDCMENPRKEDFENAHYVREQYRPVCMRVEGEGMALSKMVCRKPE